MKEKEEEEELSILSTLWGHITFNVRDTASTTTTGRSKGKREKHLVFAAQRTMRIILDLRKENTRRCRLNTQPFSLPTDA